MKTFNIIVEAAWEAPHSELVEHEVTRDLNKIWTAGEYTVHTNEDLDGFLSFIDGDGQEDRSSDIPTESKLKSFSVRVEVTWEALHFELAEHEVIRDLNKIWTPGEYTVHVEEDVERFEELLDEGQ